MSKQKRKGNAFERVTADLLTEVFGLKFFRTPGSGAYVGGKNSFRADELTSSQQLLMEGDVVVPEELNYLKFECKTLKAFSFSSLLDSNSILDSWIKQASDDGMCRKMWFLIFKINNRGVFIVYEKTLYDRFSHLNSNRVIYNNVVIERIGGFFEANKEKFLNGFKD